MSAKSANLYARIEPNIKEQAEKILNALGIPASNAINMFYKQIILQKGIPFDVKLPTDFIMGDTPEELTLQIETGYNDYLNGRIVSAEDAFASIKKDAGL